MVTRFPARLLVFNTETGKVIQSLSAVGDWDDVFFDQARKRIYASGGEGAISVFEQQTPDQYKGLARIPHREGSTNELLLSGIGALLSCSEASGIAARQHSGLRAALKRRL